MRLPGYHGHQEVVDALSRELPPVTLLLGPASVGKWTLATRLAEHHRVAAVDRMTVTGRLLIDTVRAVIDFVARAGFGPYKLVTARLDEATEPALNALLKTLEEPPAAARFLLTSAAPVLDTVASRAAIFRLGLLPPAELRQILLQAGMSAKAADRAAQFGGGQVRPALAADTGDAARTAALAVVKAVATGDRLLFDNAFGYFDEPARAALLAWCTEILTGRYVRYTPADTFGLSRERVRGMLLAVCGLADARARLGVRAALEPLLAG